MVIKKVSYKSLTEYLFPDQKRKLKVMQRIKENIIKFDLKPEDVGVFNSLNMSYEYQCKPEFKEKVYADSDK